MKLARHNEQPTSAGSWYFIIPLLFVLISLCVNSVTADVQNPEEFRQIVADMKADIKAGRATPISSSTEGARLIASVRLDPQVSLPGGTVERHSADRLSEEHDDRQSARYHTVKPLTVDRFCVTNGDFMVFTQAKPRYQTEAEKRGFSWVFEGHVTNMAAVYDQRVVPHPEGDHWRAVRNATWYQPYGAGSSIAGKLNLPVVHVAYRDAFAFCVWANKRLPTEVEWHYIARAETNDTEYPWGSATDATRGNFWQGSFPSNNTMEDGYDGVSPVDAFPMQNAYGMYDLLGNVWEWTSTVYQPVGQLRDRNRPKYTAKGGSFVDQNISISSRLALYPVYSAENVGFRCVESVSPPVTSRGDGRRRSAGRNPTRHRLSETWSYKVKQAFSAIISGDRLLRNEEL